MTSEQRQDCILEIIGFLKEKEILALAVLALSKYSNDELAHLIGYENEGTYDRMYNEANTKTN